MSTSANPPFDSKLKPMCNAWIFLNEDHPAGTNYNSPDSLFQRLIKKKVYQACNIINLAFVDIVPTSSKTIPQGKGESYTLFLDKVTHPADPNGTVPTNQDYMEWIVRDAKKQNPKIKVCLTLLYGKQHLISQIYPDPNNPDKAAAEAFANNVVQYLEYYNLDGFDIDWEWDYLSNDTTKAQFKQTFSVLGPALKRAGKILTMGPATTQNLDADTVSENFDIIAFQMYYSNDLPSEFVRYGISPDKFAYGAKFESNFQTADQAFIAMQQNGFKAVTTWRLNSDNYQFEQDQQLKLSALVNSSKLQPALKA